MQLRRTFGRLFRHPNALNTAPLPFTISRATRIHRTTKCDDGSLLNMCRLDGDRIDSRISLCCSGEFTADDGSHGRLSTEGYTCPSGGQWPPSGTSNVDKSGQADAFAAIAAAM